METEWRVAEAEREPSEVSKTKHCKALFNYLAQSLDETLKCYK